MAARHKSIVNVENDHGFVVCVGRVDTGCLSASAVRFEMTLNTLRI